MKKTEELVITKCKNCKSENLVEKTDDVISDKDVNKFEKVNGLYCTSCGTFHGEDFVQHKFKIGKFGFKKTLEINAKNLN